MKEYTPQPEKKDLTSLQYFQYKHDATFHPDVLQMDERQQVRHCMQHLSMIVGEMGRYCDRMDHGKLAEAAELLEALREKRVPDLLVYALKLSTLLGDSLQEIYLQRIKDGETRRMQ